MFGAKTPFGGGGFGTSSSAFGTQPTTPFGASSGGLFGSKTPAAGTFGTPSFGNTPSSGLFGGTSTGTSLFGNKTSQSSTGFNFGSTATNSGGLFGGTSLFQAPQSSNAFGATKTSGFGGFGSTSSSSNPFGSTSITSTGMFGGSSVFGNQQQTTSGTSVKFTPVTSTEQVMKSGLAMNVKTQNQCITVMVAYKDKSVEELRLEDYAVGRKGSSTGGFGGLGGGTNLFGSNASKSGTSLFGNTAASKSNAFGGFGSTSTSGGLFGQTSGGLFGAKTTSSLFGASTTTTASGFGGFGSGLGSTTSTGLFGNTSQSTNLFGGGSGFGATSSASSGSLFGGTSAFGQPANTGTSLFGASAAKPTFGFGATSGTGFGANNTLSSGGLFGSTAAKPAFGFGTSTGGFGTSTTSAGSLFGGATTGGLFGNKPGGFGTTGFGTSTGTAGASLFGGTAGSGFGTLGAGANLGGSTIGGLSSIDQTTLAALHQQQIIQQQMKAITNTPFGDSPLFRNLTEKTKEKTTVETTNVIEPLSRSQYKVLSRPAARVKPRPISSPSLGKSQLFEGISDDHDFSPHPLVPRRNVKKLVIKSKNADEFDSVCDQLRLRADEEKEEMDVPSPGIIKTKTGQSTFINQSPQINQNFNNTISELNKTPMPGMKKRYTITPLSNSIQEESPNVATENSEFDNTLPLCKVVLTRPEYFTMPTFEELNGMVLDGKCLVQDFVIGRDGYGQVKFFGITNVYGLNLDEIVFFTRREVEVYPDNYKNKPGIGEELNKPAEITLYKVWPNDKTTHTPIKSPERLKMCGFIERIEEKTLIMEALFVDYRPQEGAWVFKVNHFTRYGIQEQFIGEDIVDTAQTKKTLKPEFPSKKLLSSIINDDIHFEKEKIMSLVKEQVKDKFLQMKSLEEEDEKSIEIDSNSDVLQESTIDTSTQYKEETEESAVVMEEEVLPFSHQLGCVAQIKPFNIQGMKTMLLDDEEENIPQKKPTNKSLFDGSLLASKTYSSFPRLDLSAANLSLGQDTLNNSVFGERSALENEKKVQKRMTLFKTGVVSESNKAELVSTRHEPVEKASIFIKCRSYGMIPYEQSLLCGKTSQLADASLMHGREFNVRWMDGFKFIHTGDKLGDNNGESECASLYTSSFSRPSPFGLLNSFVFKEQLNEEVYQGGFQFIEDCLAIALKNTEFVNESSTALSILKMSNVFKTIRSYVEKADAFKQIPGSGQTLFTMHSDTWQLVECLWGEQDLDGQCRQYEVHAARRKSLSGWLRNVATDRVRKEVETYKVKDNGHLSMIFSYLSGNQIRSASQVARENKEIRLAFLIAQCMGEHHLKYYLCSQLSLWEERNIDSFMDVDHLKLYVLLSGMMVWKSTNHNINLCQHLDWKRSLALHLWYFCSATATINDAFAEFQKSFKGTDTYEPYSVFPSPSCNTNDAKMKDVCYHLLALYCKREHSLEKLLTPTTHVENPLDHHLSWHLQRVLDELGYSHMSDESHTALQFSYAAQLENIGLWHWSVFVLMHLRDEEARELSVKRLLSRCCRVNDDHGVQLNKEERMIVDDFHVPSEWLHEAKALHARYSSRFYEEALHLIRAGHWHQAHIVTVQHLAADAIINEDFDWLKNILLDISLPERCCTVKNWKIGGQVYLGYILLKEKLENIKSNETLVTSYHLEDMENEIASLINCIAIMDVQTSKERLCQSEMARSCSNMLKIVFAQMKTDEEDNEDVTPKWSSLKVAPYVVDLPLPPDYYLKELRELLANYAQEMDNTGDFS